MPFDAQPPYDGKDPVPKRPYRRKSAAELKAAKEAKIARELVRVEKLRNRLSALETRAKNRERKTDTRRKIVVGAIALETARRDAAFKAQLWKLLDEFVERPLDRELFGLNETS